MLDCSASTWRDYASLFKKLQDHIRQINFFIKPSVRLPNLLSKLAVISFPLALWFQNIQFPFLFFDIVNLLPFSQNKVHRRVLWKFITSRKWSLVVGNSPLCIPEKVHDYLWNFRNLCLLKDASRTFASIQVNFSLILGFSYLK